MSFDNANLPSVSNLLAITTKNAMEKRVSEIDQSECLYPINKNKTILPFFNRDCARAMPCIATYYHVN